MRALELPEGFAVRVATVDDSDALADLINDVNVAEVGVPWTTAEEVRGDLTAPNRDPRNDLVLVDPGGALAGYLNVSADDDDPSMVNQIAWVRPNHWGVGLSSALLRLGEREAARFADAGAVLHVACWATNESAQRLFAALGYARVRTFHQMRIELGARVDAVGTPGIEIRAFDPAGDAASTHAALAEAFEDHWGRPFDPYELWVHQHIDGPGADFDPQLWFVAVEDREIVGAICTRAHLTSAPDTASVDLLAVRRQWRGRGIARALLQTTFEAVRGRGIGAVELGVDSTNPTGATHLYEGVGMRPIRSFEIWEKRIVPLA